MSDDEKVTHEKEVTEVEPEEYNRLAIFKAWEIMSAKLINFTEYMRSDVLEHLSPEYAKTFEKNFGSIFDMGTDAMKKVGTKIHPFSKIIAQKCYTDLKFLRETKAKMEEEGFDHKTIVLPDNLVDDPSRLVRECPREHLYKILKYMYFFAVSLQEVYILEAKVAQSEGRPIPYKKGKTIYM